MLDITAVAPQARQVVKLWPSGTPEPATSNLNAESGEVVSNLAIVRKGADGNIAVRLQASGHLVIDVVGITFNDSVPRDAVVAMAPVRAYDSRQVASLPARGTVTLNLRELASLPDQASGAFLNVTTITSQATWFTVWPAGESRPAASSIDAAEGVRANASQVALSPTGQVSIYSNATVPVEIVVDVQGYYRPADSGQDFKFLSSRLVDTRLQGGALQPGEVRDIAVGGLLGMPQYGIDSVFINLATTSPAASGHLQAYSSGWDAPTASVVNFEAGAGFARSELVLLRPGDGGRVTIKNVSLGTVHLVADVQGWFSAVRTIAEAEAGDFISRVTANGMPPEKAMQAIWSADMRDTAPYELTVDVVDSDPSEPSDPDTSTYEAAATPDSVMYGSQAVDAEATSSCTSGWPYRRTKTTTIRSRTGLGLITLNLRAEWCGSSSLRRVTTMRRVSAWENVHIAGAVWLLDIDRASHLDGDWYYRWSGASRGGYHTERFWRVRQCVGRFACYTVNYPGLTINAHYDGTSTANYKVWR